MHMTKTCLLLLPSLLCSIVFSGTREGQPKSAAGRIPGPAIFGEGEELVYEVSWTFFKLGVIRLKSYPNFTAEASINSYEGVPFVDLHSIHFSAMDTLMYSRASHSIDKKETEWVGLDYLYDYANKCLTVEKTFQKDALSTPYKRVPYDTVRLASTSFIDGISIAYFPRMLIHTSQTVAVPTVLYGKLGTTTFRLPGNRTTEKIDALENPVRVVEIDGTTDVEGIYGMTGDFTGWFSDDGAAVPIKGKLKVLLGNVNVELIQWRRTGWNPPTETE
jgi:hypothetical protein